MHVLFIVVPVIFGLACLALPDRRMRLASLVAGTMGHLGVTAWSWSAGFRVRTSATTAESASR